MKKGIKTVVILLTILVCVNTITLYKINDRTEKTYTYVEHSDAFITELINVLTGKVNGLVSAVNQEKDSAVESEKMGKTTIGGSFVATVRELIPDYVLDDATPAVAIVTVYQETPFAVYIGKDLASQVEAGKTYEFFIKEKAIEVTQEQYEIGPMSPNITIPTYSLSISCVAPITDAGLDFNHLTYQDFVR